MVRRGSPSWMWADALGALARAEQLHRQVFHPGASRAPRACWEPPVDVFETESEVLIVAALPGVTEDHLEAGIDGSALVIAGERVLPGGLEHALIHRMELPRGRFERRVPLPAGRYGQIRTRLVDGCLIVSLRKSA